jgi:hypothetical protein
MILRSGPPRDSDTVPGRVLLELVISASAAWTFINAPAGTSWWIEVDEDTYFNYSGCRLIEHHPMDADMVRLVFTYDYRSSNR